jgi:hypothetical protein
MQQDSIDCAAQAMEKFNIEKDIAACELSAPALDYVAGTARGRLGLLLRQRVATAARRALPYRGRSRLDGGQTLRIVEPRARRAAGTCYCESAVSGLVTVVSPRPRRRRGARRSAQRRRRTRASAAGPRLAGAWSMHRASPPRALRAPLQHRVLDTSSARGGAPSDPALPFRPARRPHLRRHQEGVRQKVVSIHGDRAEPPPRRPQDARLTPLAALPHAPPPTSAVARPGTASSAATSAPT